jgi:hypothetical protein
MDFINILGKILHRQFEYCTFSLYISKDGDPNNQKQKN